VISVICDLFCGLVFLLGTMVYSVVAWHCGVQSYHSAVA